MKKLIIFGDSFANYDWIPVLDKTWGASLGALLQIPVINYGVSGSALLYSFNKFIEYYQSDDYSDDDVIVFVTTDIHRLYTANMTEGLKHFGNIVTLNDNMGARMPLEKEWLNNNVDSAIWTIMNVYDDSINYEFIKTLSFLQTWAAEHLTNKLIILRAFPAEVSEKTIEKLVDLIVPTNNFFPILHGKALGHLVAHEFKTFNGFASGPDIRINHMSPENRQIIASMLYNLIITQDISKWQFSEFKKDLYDDCIPGWNYTPNPDVSKYF